MGINIAVVGATGNVGREILNILDEREFPAEEVVALASTKSVGKETNFGDSEGAGYLQLFHRGHRLVLGGRQRRAAMGAACSPSRLRGD